MNKDKKETAILIAVCAFISLLILSPFIFFILSNESKTETVYSNYMTIKDKYKKVKPAEKEAFMNYISTLQQKGYIETLSSRTETVHAQKLTDDDFAARITSVFLPFIDVDIPDGKFILLQEKIKEILREHGRNLQKEEKA